MFWYKIRLKNTKSKLTPGRIGKTLPCASNKSVTRHISDDRL